MRNLIPCATLTRALTLIAHPRTWIQLLPGSRSSHSHSQLLEYRATTIASAPPSFTPDELALLGNGSWAVRMQETAASGQAATIDCTGSRTCFITLYSDIRFLGLTFTGSSEYAIVSLSDDSTDANARLPPSTLSIENCVFNGTGAVLLKTKGSVAISGCTITNSLPWANTTLGLIELEDASLTMTETIFSHNHLPIADTFLRSCIRSKSFAAVRLSITESNFLDNSASVVESDSPAIPGGVAVQVQANGPLFFHLSDSSFVQQNVRCSNCNGGQQAQMQPQNHAIAGRAAISIPCPCSEFVFFFAVC